MAYEFRYNFNLQGVDALSQVPKITQQIGSASKEASIAVQQLEAILRAEISAGNSLGTSLKNVAEATAQAAPEVSKLANEAFKLVQAETAATTAANSQAVAIRGMASAHARGVTDVQALSAAIRGLEGTLSIRAVEQFSAKILGLGGIAQTVFPIVGAIASVAIFHKGYEALKKFTDGFDPLVQAEKRAADGAKELDSELNKVRDSLRSIQEQNATQILGSVIGSQIKASNINVTDVPKAEQNVGLIRARLATEQSEVTTAQQRLNRIDQNGGDPAAFSVRSSAAKELAAAQKNAETTSKELSVAEAQLANVRQKALGANAAAAKEQSDQIQKAKDEANDVARQRAERARSVNDAAQRSREQIQRSALGFINRDVESTLSPVNRELFQRDTALGSQPFNEFQREGIEQATRRRVEATLQKEQEAQRKLPFQLDDSGGSVFKGVDKSGGELESEVRDQAQSAVQLAVRVLIEGIKKNNSELKREDAAQIAGIRQGAEQQSRLIGITGRNNPVAAAQQELAVRTQAIQAEAAIVEKHSELYDIDQERLKQQNELQRAQAEYLDTVSRIAEREKEAFGSFAQNLVGAAFQGSSGISKFFEQQAKSLLGTITKNIATEVVYPAIKGSIPQAKGGILGTILQGTPFGGGSMPSGTQLNPIWVKNADLTLSSGGTSNAGSGKSVLDEIRKWGGGDSDDATSNDASSQASNGGSSMGGSAANYGGLSGVFGGLSHTGDLRGIFTGVGSNETLSNSERLGAGIGTGLAVAGGAYQAFNQFSRGGARGIAGGIGALAGTAALLDPEPISKAVLIGVSAVSSLVSTLFGDPKANRQGQIQKQLTQAQYFAPIAINQTRDSSGNYVDFDKFGGLRQSPFSAIPQISEPYLHYRDGQYVPVPGGVNSQFGGATSQPPMAITINAMDGADVHRVLMNNKEAVGNAAAAHLASGDNALASRIRYLS